MRRLCRFSIPGSHPPNARRSKKRITCTPSLVFATIIIIRKENPKAFRRNPAGQKAEIARPLYVWSAVTRGSQKRQTTNKTPLRQMFINKHAPVPFTREQWQPRYLPSFLSNSNKPPDTRPAQVILHEHATVTDFSLKETKPFPQGQTPKVISIHTPPQSRRRARCFPT